MAVRAYYQQHIKNFVLEPDEFVLGVLVEKHEHTLEHEQRNAWLAEIAFLKRELADWKIGVLFLEFQIPRMGKRADAVLLLPNAVIVLEFKIGADAFAPAAVAQVEDYALDLKNFHLGSHGIAIVPLLIATRAEEPSSKDLAFADDGVAAPILTGGRDLATILTKCVTNASLPSIEFTGWMNSGYRPTPTIVEAAQALYRDHTVEDIARSDASAKNLSVTTAAVWDVVDAAIRDKTKSICFVTGVPGAGKTLAGMNIAMRRSSEKLNEHAVFLSGNGPLVDVLREALTRDQARREQISKNTAARRVRGFIQNIHHFRDQYLSNTEVPAERVVIFDEAQRAWDLRQASAFMQAKRGVQDFGMSEPEFLLSVMDRHEEWCTVVCLVGGGQEINTGEAGIQEWLEVLASRFPGWRAHLSAQITSPEYGTRAETVSRLREGGLAQANDLHLAVSMRSFRSEKVSAFVHHLVENEPDRAGGLLGEVTQTYRIFVTRELGTARAWLRGRARGTERYGLIASSGAQRLRPHGIHIKAAIDPPTWFLNDNNDVRSSFYLEEVATEFAVQGLELDWVGVCWDGNFYHDGQTWASQQFKGTRWQVLRDQAKRTYLKNAYRVILTRARQGMVIFVPRGEGSDPTRQHKFYDGTYEYLRMCGIPTLDA